MIKDFFLWCSGVDKNILSICEEYVVTKYSILGVLVLVPAILAFISMSYALSTIDAISKLPYVYITGGFFWGFIVFNIDRYIVSTHFNESKVWWKKILNASFLIRFFFSLILGVTISHPLVMFCFDGVIKQELNREINSEKDAILESIKERKQAINSNNELLALQNRKKCLEKLKSYEETGEKIKESCGATTGKLGIGIITINNQAAIDRTSSEISNLKSSIKSQLNNDEILKKLNNQFEEVESTFSTDYTKRNNALNRIKKDNYLVTVMLYLLMLIFILVDLIPLILVTFTRPTIYDKIILDTDEALKGIDRSPRRSFLEELYTFYHSVDEIKNKKVSTGDFLNSIKQGVDNFKKVEKLYDITPLIVFVGVALGIIIAIVSVSPRVVEVLNIDTYNNNISTFNVDKTLALIQNLNINEIATGTAALSFIAAIILALLEEFIKDYIPRVYRYSKKIITKRLKL